MSSAPESFFTRWIRKYKYLNLSLLYLGTALVVIHFTEAIIHGLHMPAITFTLVVVLALAGLPIVLLVAWAMEKPKVPVIPISKKKKGWSAKWLKITASVVLSAGIFIASLALYSRFFKNAVDTNSKNTIAVLPFTDMSEQKDQEYFGDGLAEEIINALTRIKHFGVIGRTSSFQFKGEKKDLTEIGKKLNADIILEGSIRKSGNRVRVTAQLIRAKENSHIWSEVYDRELTDIFQIQDDIAENIVDKLKLTVSAPEKKRINSHKTDTSVYNLYLKAMHEYRQNNFEQSMVYNLEAISKDPDYAPSYAFLSLAKTWMIARGSIPDINPADLAEAKNYAETAIRLDPDLAEGYSAIALISWMIDRDYAKARNYFEKSIELNPGASLLKNRYGYFLTWMGELRKANKMGKDAKDSDPSDLNSYVIIAITSIYSGNYQEAEKIIQTGRMLFPNHKAFNLHHETNLFYRGDYAWFKENYKNIDLTDSSSINNLFSRVNNLSYYAIALARTGNKKESDRIITTLKKIADKGGSGNYQLAQVYAANGQVDSCFSRLEKSIMQQEQGMRLLKIEPLFNDLRDDPRYQKLYKQYGYDKY